MLSKVVGALSDHEGDRYRAYLQDKYCRGLWWHKKACLAGRGIHPMAFQAG